MDTHKLLLGLAVGVLAISYCVYFSKRRTESRNKRKELRKTKSDVVTQPPPDPDDHEAMFKYFITELKNAKELLTTRNFDAGILHLANAVRASNERNKLLQLLENMLPDSVYTDLMLKIQDVTPPPPPPPPPTKHAESNVETLLTNISTATAGADGI